MTAKISRITLDKISPEDYRRCYNLNFRDEGSMRGMFRTFKHGDEAHKCTVHMIKDGDFLIAWCFCFPYRIDDARTAHFYVRRTHRNQGYGKKLMRDALKTHSKVHVSPHDRASAVFFRQYRTSLFNSDSGYRRYWSAADHYKKTGIWRDPIFG